MESREDELESFGYEFERIERYREEGQSEKEKKKPPPIVVVAAVMSEGGQPWSLKDICESFGRERERMV